MWQEPFFKGNPYTRSRPKSSAGLASKAFKGLFYRIIKAATHGDNNNATAMGAYFSKTCKIQY